MISRFLVQVLAAAILAAGCGAERVTGPFGGGDYDYKAYDAGGTLIVNGWFRIGVQDSSSISGEWHFSAAGSPQNIGPQTGDGSFEGTLEEGTISLNLNPRYADNNVFLLGYQTTAGYAGTWSWAGFPGVLNQGSFEALKR